MMAQIFYLSGFMASGKSTIGAMLANTLGWKFIDLDEEIEKNEKRKIRQIFSAKGEDYFRQLETEVLFDILLEDKLIISLGGGTLIKSENRNFIKRTGKLIFLKTSPGIIYKRLKNNKDRPVLLKNGEKQLEKETYLRRIETLMKKRNSSYSHADFIFNTDNDSIEKTVEKIAVEIRKSLKQKL